MHTKKERRKRKEVHACKLHIFIHTKSHARHFILGKKKAEPHNNNNQQVYFQSFSDIN